MEIKMGQSINSLLDILHQVHCDNSRMQYFAESYLYHRILTMPLSPFVFEYFLFNSIYQVDWRTSLDEDELIFHPSDYSEAKQQRELLKYLKTYGRNNPSKLYRAFEPLVYLPIFEGGWTKITPDARITEEDGVSFFGKIKNLQKLIEACSTPSEMPTTKTVFELINGGTYYIYLVRNNIFHGSKTLGSVYEQNQKRRIQVYEFFLKGITSLFFLSVGKDSVASDFIPCPISSNSLPTINKQEILDQNAIWSAINKKLIKIGDTRLISQFTKQIKPSKSTPSEKSALFYPSSGSDILTPLLLGLPYCTQFYFFELEQVLYRPLILTVLRNMNIPTLKFKDSSSPPRWKQTNNSYYFEFEYDGVLRKIHWIHLDNLEFLKLNVELSFYFHRGDSWGEGGSGQKWDSEHIPDLINMIPKGKKCVFLTDGEPGGIKNEYYESCNELSIPFLERERKYYYGYMAN